MNKAVFAFMMMFCMIFSENIFSQKNKTTQFIDPANMDASVKPGDNFFLYANGTWLKNNPVPASKTRWGSFDLLRQTSLDRLQILLNDASANDTKDSLYQRVGDLYKSAMDSAAIEKLGYTPIKPELQRLDSVSSYTDVLHEIATLRTKGIGGVLFGFSVGQDDKNVNQYIPNVYQGGISLP